MSMLSASVWATGVVMASGTGFYLCFTLDIFSVAQWTVRTSGILQFLRGKVGHLHAPFSHLCDKNGHLRPARPHSRHEFGLLEDEFGGFVLQIGWVAELS